MEEIISLYLYDDIKPPAKGTLKSKKDVLALKKPTRQTIFSLGRLREKHSEPQARPAPRGAGRKKKKIVSS
ncbi:MAG: hypothetical protein LBU45_08325 [Azoarcus sp.]|nr:hypothetical protein [Azoarcus sp.]